MFVRRKSELFAEGVSLADIAADIGTPFYCYSAAKITHTYTAFAKALAKAKLSDVQICYSLKANGNLAIVRLLRNLGAGADIVSGGELARARAAHIAPDKIVFSGVGKTAAELDAALGIGIYQFNVESRAELDLLQARAHTLGRKADIALRLNPDIDARTHSKITTGLAQNKFGMSWAQVQEAARAMDTYDALQLCGLDMHIGSQILTLKPFASAFAQLAECTRALRAQGHALTRLDVGGGVGIAYAQHDTAISWPAYAQCVAEHLGALDCRILFEPGRALIGAAGVLVTRVLQHKSTASKNFLIVDASMNELLRPTLYDATHAMEAVSATNAKAACWDVVGPICETGDYLAQNYELAAPPVDGLLAIYDAGAYGASLGLTYNTRPPAPEVLVQDTKYFVIRAPVPVEQLWRNETIPDILKTK